MKKILIIFFLICSMNIVAQEKSETDSLEIFILDSFIDVETDNFVLSFISSIEGKSVLFLENKSYDVSGEITDNHKITLSLKNLKVKTKVLNYRIQIVTDEGVIHNSELFEVDVPERIEVEDRGNFLDLCLFGGVQYLLPAPGYVRWHKESYFSLTKEIPLIFFKSKSLLYPAGYFSAEYSHIFNAPKKNFFRLGYKHIMDMDIIEYLAPGINVFTTFAGLNGISPEVTLGLFKFQNVFTIYSKYRFNFQPGAMGSEFHEISIGIYSGYFAFYF